jgi:hypothetical protein
MKQQITPIKLIIILDEAINWMLENNKFYDGKLMETLTEKRKTLMFDWIAL